MARAGAGGFVFRERTFRFTEANCSWSAPSLFINAFDEHDVGLRLVGVPFPGATSIKDLPGRAWEPDDDELAIHADTFAEGGMVVRDWPISILGGRVDCLRLDAPNRILVVEFFLRIADDESGQEDEADGVAYCRINPDVANLP